MNMNNEFTKHLKQYHRSDEASRKDNIIARDFKGQSFNVLLGVKTYPSQRRRLAIK